MQGKLNYCFSSNIIIQTEWVIYNNLLLPEQNVGGSILMKELFNFSSTYHYSWATSSREENYGEIFF